MRGRGGAAWRGRGGSGRAGGAVQGTSGSGARRPGRGQRWPFAGAVTAATSRAAAALGQVRGGGLDRRGDAGGRVGTGCSEAAAGAASRGMRPSGGRAARRDTVLRPAHEQRGGPAEAGEVRTAVLSSAPPFFSFLLLFSRGRRGATVRRRGAWPHGGGALPCIGRTRSVRRDAAGRSRHGRVAARSGGGGVATRRECGSLSAGAVAEHMRDDGGLRCLCCFHFLVFSISSFPFLLLPER